MQKKVLLTIIMDIMLTIAASAQTDPWNGYWRNDNWGNIHFYKTSSGSTEATYDGLGIYAAGIITGDISNDNWGRPYILTGTWKETERLSKIQGETESNSGEIELTMNSDKTITGKYKHTSGGWHTFTLSHKM